MNDGIAKRVKEELLAHVDALVELTELREEAHATGSSAIEPILSRKQGNGIFIVHGHDNELKQLVARTISQLGLDPVILHEQPSAGKTIIEKFESNAGVAFAIVLLTPDDMGFSKQAGEDTAKPRARQNVILELGYFAGKLGRNRVFSLVRGDSIESPSDLSGLVYTPFDSAGHWKFDLVKELRAAGYEVDANRLL